MSPFFHPLEKGDIPIPNHFPDPFSEIPHPIARLAAGHLQQRLAAMPCFNRETFEGKMFGVLVVWSLDRKQLGYLCGFSGNLTLETGQTTNNFLDFVPPVYDLLDPNGFFKQQEPEISDLNRQLQQYSKREDYQSALLDYQKAQAQFRHERQLRKEQLQLQKQERDQIRACGSLTSQQRDALIRQSQHEKADFKRWERQKEQQIHQLQADLQVHEQQLAALRQQRAERSKRLESDIFKAFRLTNGRGEWTDIHHLAPAAPGGTGECVAPKLLQYAYLHHYPPVALAEFWWGQPPAAELRHHGHFYPSCRGKCGLILPFMLKGLELDSPSLRNTVTHAPAEILWEDEALLVVNKPSGQLALPGKDGTLSLMEILRLSGYPDLLPVHRLDRDTSGLILFAKTPESQCLLQKQFQQQQVQKEYTALLERCPESEQGVVDLPLSPDWINRPRQQVDRKDGKPALTRYVVLSAGSDGSPTRVLFLPLTGRTHQLRVHAAHHLGLNAPICGDPLYGNPHPAKRLLLHASRISFVHPITCRPLSFFVCAEF